MRNGSRVGFLQINTILFVNTFCHLFKKSCKARCVPVEFHFRKWVLVWSAVLTASLCLFCVLRSSSPRRHLYIGPTVYFSFPHAKLSWQGPSVPVSPWYLVSREIITKPITLAISLVWCVCVARQAAVFLPVVQILLWVLQHWADKWKHNC